MRDPRPVEPGDVVAALDGAAPPPPAVLSVGQEVIAAAGAWGTLGAVVILRRDEEGYLEDDIYLLSRDSTGTWIKPSSSSGSGMPEWVLSRPTGAIVSGTLTGAPSSSGTLPHEDPQRHAPAQRWSTSRADASVVDWVAQ